MINYLTNDKILSLLTSVFQLFRHFYVRQHNYVGKKIWQNVRQNFRNSTEKLYKENHVVIRNHLKTYLSRNITTFGILSGGTSLVLSKNKVLCKAKTTRMVGYRSLSDKQLNIDWKQFWQYLKPYLKYFTLAILVSKFKLLLVL